MAGIGVKKAGGGMKKRLRRAAGTLAFDACLYAFLMLVAVAVVYPFWDTVLLSFGNPQTATRLTFHLWNDEWSTASYEYIFRDNRVALAYWNTIFRSAVATLITLATTMLAAYPLSKRNLPGRTALTFFFLFTMFFGGGLIPTYMLVKNLHLMNSLWALILPGAFSAYNMVIMRNYLMSMDGALEEAAFIEGAGYGTILLQIVVPLATPLLATVALWTIVSNWNAWFDCLIYITDPTKKVLQLLLRDMVQNKLTTADSASLASFNAINERKIAGPTVQAAMIVVTIGPIVAVYPFLQKYFVKGIMIGSLKG
jgi:putative aldouronate transport system permease protein